MVYSNMCNVDSMYEFYRVDKRSVDRFSGTPEYYGKFRVISFNNTSFDSDILDELFRCIKKYNIQAIQFNEYIKPVENMNLVAQYIKNSDIHYINFTKSTQPFIQIARSSLHNIKALSFCHFQRTHEIVQSIQMFPNLEYLEFIGNHYPLSINNLYTTDDILNIIQNTTITELQCDLSVTTNDSDLLTKLISNTNLTKLMMWDYKNYVNTSDMWQALAVNSNMVSIILEDIITDSHYVESIINLLEHNNTLTEIVLYPTHIFETIPNELIKALETNYTITKMDAFNKSVIIDNILARNKLNIDNIRFGRTKAITRLI